MVNFIKILAVGAIGYAVSRQLKKPRPQRNAAYADNQPHETPTAVRDAGPAAMRDQTRRDWSSVDEASDQSFPASDPPATY